jgi:hypothetical protein
LESLRSASPSTRAATTASISFASALESAVNHWFDSAASWFSGLPASPLSNFLQGALLLVRRTLLNNAPTAEATPTTFAEDGQLLGRIFAEDREADPISYRVVSGPTYGTVEIDSDGVYRYRPGDSFDGTDSFIVEVENPGRINLFHLFSGPNRLTVDVTRPLAGTMTNGVTFYNWTTRILALTGGGGDWDSRIDTRTLLYPGQTLHLELMSSWIHYYDGWVDFQALDDPLDVGTEGKWHVEVQTDRVHGGTNNIYVRKCEKGGKDVCGNIQVDGGTRLEVYLADPTGTKEPITDKALAQRYLNGFGCERVTCSFENAVTDGNAFGEPVLLLNKFGPFEETVTQDHKATVTSAFSRSEKIAANLYDIVSAEVDDSYSSTITDTYDYTAVYDIKAEAGQSVALWVRPPAVKVTGTLVLRTNEIELRLEDFSVYLPDTSGREAAYNPVFYTQDEAGNPVSVDGSLAINNPIARFAGQHSADWTADNFSYIDPVKPSIDIAVDDPIVQTKLGLCTSPGVKCSFIPSTGKSFQEEDYSYPQTLPVEIAKLFNDSNVAQTWSPEVKVTQTQTTNLNLPPGLDIKFFKEMVQDAVISTSRNSWLRSHVYSDTLGPYMVPPHSTTRVTAKFPTVQISGTLEIETPTVSHGHGQIDIGEIYHIKGVTFSTPDVIGLRSPQYDETQD